MIGDDAFYYLQIAFNWSRGLGSTFDGIRPTNGYQPLWEWALAIFARGFAGKQSLLEGTQWLVVTLHVAMGWGIFATLGLRYSPALGLLAGFLWIIAQPIYRFTYGMESAIYAPMLLGLYLAWSRRTRLAVEDPVACHAWLGALAGLTVLARFDALLLTLCLAGVLLVERARGAVGTRSVLAFGLSLVLILAPYFVGNRMVFGTFWPVSVLIHSRGSSFAFEKLLHWSEQVFGRSGIPNLVVPDWTAGLVEGSGAGAALFHALAIAGVTLGCACASARAGLRRDAAELVPRFPAALPFSAFLLGHWLIVASGRAATWPQFWHFVPEFIAAATVPAIGLGEVLRALARRREHAWARRAHGWIWGALAILGIRGGYLAARHWDGGPPPYVQNGWIEAAEWVNANLPDSSVVGSWDSGYFGWALKPAVMNLDGLVADYPYVRDVVLAGTDYVPTLIRLRVTHLLNEEVVGSSYPGTFHGVPLRYLAELREWPSVTEEDRRVVLFRFDPTGSQPVPSSRPTPREPADSSPAP